MDAKKLAGLLGICWHEPVPISMKWKCACGKRFAFDESEVLYEHIGTSNPDFSDSRVVLWIIRERPDFQEIYKHIGSYYCREFHAWMHRDDLIQDRTGKLADQLTEWLEGRKRNDDSIK